MNISLRKIIAHTPSLIAALLLLFAASTKGWTLSTQLLPGSRILHFLHIAAELALAIWLLSYWQRRWSILATTLCFLGFAIFSAVQLAKDNAACGCFGTFSLPPIWMLGIDLVMAVTLALAYTNYRHVESPPIQQWQFTFFLGVILIGTAALVFIILTSPKATKIIPQARLIDTNGIVVIDPQEWIGQPLPILPFVQGNADLRQDRWLVFLVHHDCEMCRSIINRIEIFRMEGMQLAVIQLPPTDSHFISNLSDNITVGELSDNTEWFAETPMALQITDGKLERYMSRDDLLKSK